MYDKESDKKALLHTGDGAPTQLSAVSKDERVKVYVSILANTYNKLFMKDGEEKKYLVPDVEKVHANFNVEIVDQTIYFSTNYESEFSYLASYEITSETFSIVHQLDGESVHQVHY